MHFLKIDVDDGAVFVADKTRIHRIAQGFGLLVDFFEHKMRVSVFFCGGHVPIHVKWRAHDFFAVFAEQINVVGVEHGKFFLLQKIHVAGSLDNRGNIARNKIFSLAQSHDQRTIFSRHDDSVGEIAANHGERV